MITQSLSRKQIIVPIGSNNIKRIIIQANAYISNINRLLKEVKSEISANFIYFNNKGIHITINKVVATFNWNNIIEKFMKDLNKVDSNDIISSRLP